ncbi:photosystem II reaction center PsbP family protein [Streptomyces sp. ISL-11]|uniref:photosystem II reaction center PsbP family protein n=1 Tax=Streptomyces sp. ISL-11 TaxID=2819174 RepID=UPI001BECAC02|nr:photosystem II reaction center PsbP family protein [Streptomyces sp. ISL-11]MBT2384804.1 hypothetical protein [Streptomyces sp. ISL-11]
MSRWDADLQQWVDDDLPPRPRHRPHDPDRPYDPDEPEVLLGPPHPDDPPDGPSHATILAGVLAGVVLAGGIGVGIWSLVRDDDSGPAGGGLPSASALPTPGSTFGGPTSAPTYSYPSYSYPSYSYPSYGAPSYVPSTPVPGTLSGSGAPTGYVRTADPAGFTLDVPRGWLRSTEGASVFYKRSDDKSLIQVFTLSGPETTPYESLVATEKTVSRNKGYRKIGLWQLSGGAAELEYTYTRDDGSTRHIGVRAYTASNSKQYALLVGGPGDDWPAHLRIYRNLLGSFCPTGSCAS